MKRGIAIIAVFLLMHPPAANAGGAKEILLGAGFGTAFGVLVGGTALAFSDDPDAVTAKYLLIGGGAGLACGALFGVFLPPDENASNAVFNLDARGGVFSISPAAALPAISFTRSAADLRLRAELLKLEF